MAGVFTDLVRYLDETEVVTIVTRRANGVEVPTLIWAVVVDGRAYVRSEFGEEGRWYRRAVARGTVVFRIGTEDAAARVHHVDDEAELDAVDAAFRRGYAHRAASLQMMLMDVARSHTLLLSGE